MGSPLLGVPFPSLNNADGEAIEQPESRILQAGKQKVLVRMSALQAG